MPDRNITISEIAKICGVSKGTVSRALIRPEMLKPETLERIQNVMREYNYRPNPAARAMNYERARNISVVAPDIRFAFQSELIKSIQEELHDNLYNLVVLDSSLYQSRTTDYQTMLKRQITLGTIFCYENDFDSIQGLNQFQPVVSFELKGPEIPSISTNVTQGVRLMMQHLHVENGHSRIALVIGREKDDYSMRTIAAFKECLNDFGIEPNPDYIVCTHWSKLSGKQAMGKLLSLEAPPTAVIYFSCSMAQGGVLECFERSIKIPEQLSVVTLDGAEENGYLIPPLTTVDLDIASIGRELARMMVHLIEDRSTPIEERVVTPVTIREGHSVLKVGRNNR